VAEMVTVYHAVRFERFGQMGGLERNSGVARGLRESFAHTEW
jgi:hypothetical protein